MSDKTGRQSDGAEKLVRDIRRATRRHFSAEEKIRIVLDGLSPTSSSTTITGAITRAWTI